MRYVFRFGLAFALSLALIAGCSDENGEGGSGGDGGTGGMAGSSGTGGAEGVCDFSLGSPTLAAVCPCSEAGIRAAIEAPADDDPFKFDCEGPQTVVSEAPIVIDQHVILDGEGNLTVVGTGSGPVFRVAGNVTAELRGFGVTGSPDGLGIANWGTLSLWDCTVSDGGMGIDNGAIGQFDAPGFFGTLTLTNSTVSGNAEGIWNREGSTLVLTNSTVSGNVVEGIHNFGGLAGFGGLVRLTNSTVSENTAEQGALINGAEGVVTLTNTIVDGNCVGDGIIASGGYNIESPDDTCDFDPDKGDQINVSAEDLNLGPLADNGGPTMTHALLTEPAVSEAIDQIPAEDCEETEDQRGFPRDSVCDVGAFEVQVTDCAGEEIFTPCTIDNEEGQCLLEQCAAFDCSSLEDGTYCEFAVLGDGTTGVCEAGRCTKPEDCTGLVDGWDCIKGEAGSCVDGECVTPP